MVGKYSTAIGIFLRSAIYSRHINPIRKLLMAFLVIIAAIWISWISFVVSDADHGKYSVGEGMGSLYAHLEDKQDDHDGTLYAEVNFRSDVINEVNERGETLLTTYASSGAVKVVRNYIKAGADVNFTNKHGYTALMLAAERGHYLTSLELVKAYTDLKIRNPVGMTAFLIAISNNFVDIAHSMADHGADINDSLPKTKISALMMAAQKGHVQCVEFLINRKAAVNAESVTKETALLFAAATESRNNIQVVEALIAAGADINHKNRDGLTALMLATSRRIAVVVEKLLGLGADGALLNEFGMNCADIAFENNDKTLLDLFKTHNIFRSMRRR